MPSSRIRGTSRSAAHAKAGEIEAWFRHFIEAVPTRTFRPLHVAVENVFDLVGTNVIAVQWDNRPVNKTGEEFYVRGVTVSQAHRRVLGGADGNDRDRGPGDGLPAG